MTTKVNIRMSGLGGQGVVTAAHILGAAATRDGLISIVNPFFGAEKRLAPAESYVRISDEPIYERGEVLFPNIIMIFHPHVITMGKCYTMPFFDGLQPGGIMLINSDEILPLSEEEKSKLAALQARIFYVPATKVALEVAGTELSTNVAMLGGLMAVSPNLVTTSAISDSIAERFGGGKFVASATTAALDDVVKSKFGKLEQLVEKNMEIVDRGRQAVHEFLISRAASA
ncbi:MAG: NADH-dependent phenylglyoxylate dehydrogenase subunit gamma [Firmicutes bacterium]|nr:NADH-dependent phenylglyoxylate dehydrogenase subunit gamma [Bacillota bacterium]MBT9157804.1 NADH-dependent phenylglyoxylate dehydrogenase subunit gamma [Bacillota bacterium]